MQGTMRRIEGATGVESLLSDTALLLADDATKVLVLDCDLIGFEVKTVDDIPTAIGEVVPIPAGQVILGYTHTHNTPCIHREALGG